MNILFKIEYLHILSSFTPIGIVPGVWDLLLLSKPFAIFDIKVGKDTLSDAQIKFRDAFIASTDGTAYEISTLEQFKQVFDLLMK